MIEPTPQQKGDALEHAVRAIETMILRSSPTYSEDTFTIEGKKVLQVAGVRHEIDIFVTVARAPGYDAIFVFECKNWEEKVGKNEIIIFAEKIRASNAQRGFFVAKSFSADAVAQAKTDSRIELLKAEDLDPGAVVEPAHLRGVHIGKIDDLHLNIEVTKRKRVKLNSGALDLTTAQFHLNGVAVDLNGYRDAWANEARERRSKPFPSSSVDEGHHVLSFNEERVFSDRQAYLDGCAVRKMSLRGSVNVYVSEAVVVSAFDVATRGRFIDMRMKLAGLSVKAGFVVDTNSKTAVVVNMSREPHKLDIS